MSDKKKAVKAVKEHITKKFGPGSLVQLNDAALDVETITTGSLAIDYASGVWGLPRGRIIELFGAESSGKTTLALSVVAHAQKNGGEVAMIDVEHAVDPAWAETLGVDISELQFSQPQSGEQTLEIVGDLVASAAFDVIVVDSVAAIAAEAELAADLTKQQYAVNARLMNRGIRRLVEPTGKTKTVLLFINQVREITDGSPYGPKTTTPGGRGLKFAASMRIDLRFKAKVMDESARVGSQVRATFLKNKVAPPFTTATFEIMDGKGIDPVREVIQMGIMSGVIVQKGAWYEYDGDNIAQGVGNCTRELESAPDVVATIRQKIIEKLDPTQIQDKPKPKKAKTKEKEDKE